MFGPGSGAATVPKILQSIGPSSTCHDSQPKKHCSEAKHLPNAQLMRLRSLTDTNRYNVMLSENHVELDRAKQCVEVNGSHLEYKKCNLRMPFKHIDAVELKRTPKYIKNHKQTGRDRCLQLKDGSGREW